MNPSLLLISFIDIMIYGCISSVAYQSDVKIFTGAMSFSPSSGPQIKKSI